LTGSRALVKPGDLTFIRKMWQGPPQLINSTDNPLRMCMMTGDEITCPRSLSIVIAVIDDSAMTGQTYLLILNSKGLGYCWERAAKEAWV
jgi:hypothetical protein